MSEGAQEEATMTFGSLFAGIGGLDLGLERAGMKCRWQVEIDPYCRKVLTKHWPDVPKYEDVRDVGKANLEPVDLICGGFPCQDISYAGKGAGLAGERSGLWYEFARIIGEMGPRIVLVENVAALLTRGPGDVLGTLASLGYDAGWESLPAGSFGAFHNRDRVFLVAHCAGAVSGVFAGPRDEWRASLESRRLFASRECRRAARRASRLEGEPAVARMVHGVSDGMGPGLGNAVVPQVAEWIGRRIMDTQR